MAISVELAARTKNNLVILEVRRHQQTEWIVQEVRRLEKIEWIVQEIELTHEEVRKLIVELERALGRGYGRDLERVRSEAKMVVKPDGSEEKIL